MRRLGFTGVFFLCLFYWILDSIWSFVSFEENLKKMIFSEPASIIDTLLLKVPPYQVVSRVTVIVLFVVIGSLITYYLKRKEITEYERKLAEQKIKDSLMEKERLISQIKAKEKQFRDLANMLPECVFESDAEMNLTYANKRAFELFGYSEHEFENGLNGIDMLTPESKELARTNAIKRLKGEVIGSTQYEGLKKDGSTFPILMHVDLIGSKEKFEGFRGVVVDISDQKAAEEQLKASLTEKETLLHEIHHRVKNNMQVISSLLSLQLGTSNNKEVDAILKENMGRVYSMATIHDTLHYSEKLSEIDFSVYIQKLAQMLSQTFLTDPGRIAFHFKLQGITLSIEKANPLGLICNEIISNSLKYAFPNNEQGEITIQSNQLEKNVLEMIIKDNGIGLPDDFTLDSTDSLGLRLVQTLVENQLNGSIEQDSQSGTQYRIRFPLESNYN